MTENNHNDKVTLETRQALINLVVENGLTIKKAAVALNLKYGTAKSIMSVFHKEGRINVCNKGGSTPTKNTLQVQNIVEELISTNPQITIRDLKNMVETRLGNNFVISKSSLYRCLETLKITCKQIHRELDRVNDPEKIQLRAEYAMWYMNLQSNVQNKFIFIDESSFNTHIKRNQGWSHINTRVNVLIPTVRGRSITLIAALTDEGIIHSEIITQTTVNANIFDSFFRNLCNIVRQNYANQNIWFIFDNARIHKESYIKENCDNFGFNYKYLSPYSYMLNPIENAFSKIKIYVRNSINVTREFNLAELMNNAVGTITAADFTGYNRYMLRNLANAALSLPYVHN